MKERIETHLKCLQLINAIQSPIFFEIINSKQKKIQSVIYLKKPDDFYLVNFILINIVRFQRKNTTEYPLIQIHDLFHINCVQHRNRP